MERFFLEGFLLQASLIFALGAQNLFVLEAGMHRQYPLIISFVCFFCDLILIMLGVAGAATIFASFSQLKIIIGIIGVAFLVQYGISKIFHHSRIYQEDEGHVLKKNLKRSILLAITFSILNPHAYLDAFILIGGYSSKYDLLENRLMIGWGAACFSLVWFILLSMASSFMKPILENPKRLRFVMTCSGIVLLVLSVRLGRDVYGWIMDEPQSQVIMRTIPYFLPSSSLFTSILY